jgi:16S rRNA (guanine966-N2)-methyltransferase
VTRVIGGSARGRKLAVPPTGTRPTSDRAREGLFNSIEARAGLPGARVLDLYAGSGAVGLEALSRGARSATLVESAPGALAVLRANVAALGLPGAEVVAAPVERWLAGPPPGAAYGVVFADPPYALPDDELAEALRALASPGWLEPGALLAVERGSRADEPRWPDGVWSVSRRRYGEGALWYGRAS